MSSPPPTTEPTPSPNTCVVDDCLVTTDFHRWWEAMCYKARKNDGSQDYVNAYYLIRKTLPEIVESFLWWLDLPYKEG